jgi:fused signal recognition particle receptor
MEWILANWIWIAVGSGVPLLGGSFFYLLKKKKRSTVERPLVLGLEKTRRNLLERLDRVVKGGDQITEARLAELEELLIGADLGVATTQKLLTGLQRDMASTGHREIQVLKEYLAKEILQIFQNAPQPEPVSEGTQVVMVVGVNGGGKTTSIGKIAHQLRGQGHQILLAAADTFRAGAVGQLKVWGDRIGVQTLAQKEGSDPAAVAYDAVVAGQARGMDRVLIDTAGRLHTKVNLMEELKKVKRVIAKALPSAPHEIWLVIDATQGQNALQQARQFHEALGLTGIILTKLDGTPKGGIAVAIVDTLTVPIRYIGIGEKLEDLKTFDAREFVDALLA